MKTCPSRHVPLFRGAASLFFLAAFVSIQAKADLVISNVRSVQRVGTEYVDIHYDLTDDGIGTAEPQSVNVWVSDDNGQSFDVHAASFSGKGFGAGQTAGKDKLITWNAGVDWNLMVSPDMRFELKAALPDNLVRIPAGSFTMGDDNNVGNANETVHSVQVSGFYIGKHEVTKALWDEVRNWGATHGHADLLEAQGKAANHPVHSVSWYECVKWCNAYSEKQGRKPCYDLDTWNCDFSKNGYRLPTEAEWEKAARGKLVGQIFPWGNTISHDLANYFSDPGYTYDVSPTRGFHPVWSNGNDLNFPYTSPVGSFKSNGYGLYDMAGNVWEWCWDIYGAYPTGSVTDPAGAPSGTSRVYRGGSWRDFADGCRASKRFNSLPDSAVNNLGFRVARSVLPRQSQAVANTSASLVCAPPVAFASASSRVSNRTFVDTRDPLDGNVSPLKGIPKLVDVTTTDGRRLISYEMAKQSLIRPATGSVILYLQIKVPSFAGVNGGWGADKGGLGSFYGLEMKTFSKVEALDSIQYKIGGNVPTPDTPTTNWKPVSFDSIINIPLKQGTCYFKVKLACPTGVPQPLTVSARFKSARLCNSSGGPVTLIDPNSELWLLSHGKIDGENSFRTMNLAVKKAAGKVKVATLDWASGADGELTDLTNGRYFVNLGKNVAQLLKDHGRSAVNVDWVGHSWGTYIGYESAKAFGQVNRFVALDPAAIELGGYDDTKMNFAAVSMVSTGVKGGDSTAFAGSEVKARTCDFSIRLYSENAVPTGLEFITFYHSLPRAWFIHSMNNTTNPYWTFFGQTLLRTQLKPTMPPGWGSYYKLDGFNLECHGGTNSDNGSSDFVSHKFLLYNPSGVITEARATKKTDGSVVWNYKVR